MPAPGTENEKGTDPLSAHIHRRKQSGYAINNDLDEPDSISRQASQGDEGLESGSPRPVTSESKRSRVSLFAKLQGKVLRNTVDDETPDESCRAEGAHATTFSGASETNFAPNYIRVRSSNKPVRRFNNLFLAQELSTKPDSSAESHTKTESIWTMKFSVDGRYLAAAGEDKVIRVWAVLASREDRATQGTGGLHDGVTLSAPVFNSRPYREYSGHTSDVLDLSWSRNSFLLSSSMDRTVRLWHASRNECLCCFQHKDFVTSIAFHPKDDRFFLSGALDCHLRLWSIVDKKVVYWNRLPEFITAVAFSPDGRTSIAGTLGGLCLFYDTVGLNYNTQIHVRSSRGRYKRGSKISGIETINVYPDNLGSDVKILITTNDSRIRIYNNRDKSLEVKLKGNLNTCSQIRAAYSDDGQYVISGSEDRQVYIWNIKADPAEKKERRGYEHFEAHSAFVTAALFAPVKSRQLLAASGDPIYDIVEQYAHRHIPSAWNNQISVTENIPNYKHATTEPGDGNIIVCADLDGHIKIFRQDSASSYRNREDKSDTASILSRRVFRRSSQRSTNSLYRNSVVSTDSHTARIEPPAASHLNKSSSMSYISSSVNRDATSLKPSRMRPPELQVNNDKFLSTTSSSVPVSPIIDSNLGSQKLPKQQTSKGACSRTQYFMEGGASLGYYDLSNDGEDRSPGRTADNAYSERPSNQYRSNTATTWGSSFDEDFMYYGKTKDPTLLCRRCGSSTFNAAKVEGSSKSTTQLICTQCDYVMI